MEWFVVFTLVLNIILDDLFIGILSDGVDVVTGGPEVCAPQYLFYFRVKGENLSGSDTLDDSDDSSWRQSGNGLEKEVNMIFIGSDLKEMDFVTL